MSRLLLLVALMLLLSCTLYLFFVSIGGLPHDTPPGAFTVAVAHAAPAALTVDALSVPDGVLVVVAMTRRQRRYLLIAIALAVVASVLCCRYVPSYGPMAYAAPATPDVRWTPRGALVTWSADGQASAYTISRCRQSVGCVFLDLIPYTDYLDCSAQNGDTYWLGALAERDGGLTLLGFSETPPLSGGRVWLPVVETVQT